VIKVRAELSWGQHCRRKEQRTTSRHERRRSCAVAGD
jgi:hypothetical protein